MYMFAPPTRLNAGMIIALLLAVAIFFFLFRSSPGFQLRAMGKDRRAANFFRIPIASLTVWTMALSGALAGLGGAVQISAINHRLYGRVLAGAFLTVAYANTFVENISAGRGFVALAVVILGRRNAWGLAAASILFGAAMALQFGLQALGTAIPYQLFLALPYALTLIVLAFFGGQSRDPSALGIPYTRS
jgi:simple sugar transport system permease protein